MFKWYKEWKDKKYQEDLAKVRKRLRSRVRTIVQIEENNCYRNKDELSLQ